jgi:hypothetical protein
MNLNCPEHLYWCLVFAVVLRLPIQFLLERAKKKAQSNSRSTEMDTATYEYWPQGWLKKITFTNGTTVVFNYDNVGNRTSVVTTCSGTC